MKHQNYKMKNTLVASSIKSILMKNTTSGHVENNVEDQDSEDHHSRGHRVIHVVEGDRLEGNLTDQKWPFLIREGVKKKIDFF